MPNKENRFNKNQRHGNRVSRTDRKLNKQCAFLNICLKTWITCLCTHLKKIHTLNQITLSQTAAPKSLRYTKTTSPTTW